MADHESAPDAEGIPTVKNFMDLEYPRYQICRRLLDLYGDCDGFESPENYEPGGFCPIDLSFKRKPYFINERYEVIYKLGYGGYGMIWLCYEEAVKKWRAVKVGAASQTEELSGELLVESTLKQHSVGVDEALENNVVLPLETFWIDSINGKHLCTVLPLLGPRLSDWVEHLEEEDPGQSQRIVSQMVQGMGFLHQHGICHGDFRPQNILMQLKDGGFDDLGIDEMANLLGIPEMVDIILGNYSRSPFAPEKHYSSVSWSRMDLSSFVSDNIAIVDFGEAYLSADPNPRKPGIPGSYAAPEIVMGVPKGIGADIWALARTILEFRSHNFYSDARDTYSKVHGMEEFLGPCPATFRAEVQKQLCIPFGDDEDWMDPERYYIFKESMPGFQEMAKEYDHHVERFLALYSWHGFELSREEIPSLGDLLRNMFRWRPEERWPTDKILAHRWFTEQHQHAVLYKVNRTIESRKKSTEDENEPEISSSVSREIDAADSQTEPTEPTELTAPIEASEASKSSELREAAAKEDTNPALSETKTERQPVKPCHKAAWLYLGVLTMVIYFSGVIALISFFLAHLLANQPGFYANRLGRGSTSNDAAGQLSPVVQHVVITFILQA
ncbi:kinase-like domain-containing protein [Apiospora marii]|uniref:EKC/KEOPS complex subunit BUD32 n=1 Tax=Apiospora marii TaxID=335849 RepID=A0ABR1RM49_9PEZI